MAESPFSSDIINKIASLYWAESVPVCKDLLNNAVHYCTRLTAHLRCSLQALSGSEAFLLCRLPTLYISSVSGCRVLFRFSFSALRQKGKSRVYALPQTSPKSDLWGPRSQSGKLSCHDAPSSRNVLATCMDNVLHRRPNRSLEFEATVVSVIHALFGGPF